MEQSYQKKWEDVVHFFKTDAETGLSERQAKKQREKFGYNGKY